MSLSPSQKAAVERTGQDACCVAGPGSGKTSVLVERFAWLISSGVAPARILAITFTEKAAAEIKNRVVALIRERFADQPDVRRAVERAQVSTIHGLCHALLSEHAIRAGLDPRFKILDEMDAALEQHAALDTVLNRLVSDRRDEFLELAAKWKTERLASDLLDVWPEIRAAGGAGRALAQTPTYDPMRLARALVLEIQQLLESPLKQSSATRQREAAAREWIASLGRQDIFSWSAALPFNAKPGSSGDPVKEAVPRLKETLAAVRREASGAAHVHLLPFLRDLFTLFEEEYARRRRALAALDFDDLEEKALSLLTEDATVRSHTQERYDAILMDELQDTNPIQWRIVNLIRRPGRFFAVGDLNQSIFGFRSAEPELFRQYRQSVETAGGVIDILDRNYRSRQPILDAAINVLVPCNRGVTQHQLTAEREFPPAGEPVIEALRVPGDSSDIEWMASRLRELYGTLLIGPPGDQRCARFSDMAVLARTSTPFPLIQQALSRFGIPFVVDRGSNFFEEPAIVDLTNLLRVLVQPDDDIALFGLLRSPLFGAGDEEIALLRLHGQLAPAPAAARLNDLRREAIDGAPQPALARFLDETGYLASLSAQGRADVTKFFTLLDKLSEEFPGDLQSWLDRIADLRAQAGETTAPIREAGDAVTVLSMHKAKGLEFPIVALVNLQSPPRGDTGPIAFHPELGLGLRWRDPTDETSHIDDAVLTAIHDRESRRAEQEEDRLLYVAMTRAKEKLLLCWRDTKSGLRSDWPRMIETALASADPSVVAWPEISGEHEIPPPPVIEGAQPSPPIAPSAEDPPEAGPVAVTALLVFEECPWRYFLQSVVRWPEPGASTEPAGEADQPSGASFGSEVHNALAGLPAGPDALQMAGRFHSSALGRRAASAARVFREFDFLFELEGRLMRGQIDLWFEEPGGVVLVDYKTDLSLTEARIDAYSRQLRYYALALQRLTGSLPAEAFLFDLRRSRALPVSLAEPELDRCIADWRAFQSARDARQFAPRPGARCAECPYSAGVCSAAQS